MAQNGSTGIAVLFFNLCARWGWVVNTTPRPLYPREGIRYPLYRSLGGPQGGCRRVRKISPTPEADLRTVQRVASRRADWAIPFHCSLFVR